MPKVRSSPESSEWLVADQRGGFAMGTSCGFRTRKYHSFYSGIAGRSETSFLTDIELFWGEHALWPHAYGGAGVGSSESVIHPSGSASFIQEPFPRWSWKLPEGKLSLEIQPQVPGGIALRFEFHPTSAKSVSKQPAPALPLLRLRPFFAMRNLHGIGGLQWDWTSQEKVKRTARVTASSGKEVSLGLRGPWMWQENSLWYRNFFYAEENQRGYQAQEDLYSAGELSLDFNFNAFTEVGILVSVDPSDAKAYAEHLPGAAADPNRARVKKSFAAGDFILHQPAGIVAGYPWFGEWGRDTFVALPGIMASWLSVAQSPDEVWCWAHEVLSVWGQWIEKVGMLPNLIEKERSHQWESSDATLWWCHSLAALWQLSLTEAKSEKFELELVKKYRPLLTLAVDSIQQGRHPFLKVAANGLVEVTEAHTTWMDARFESAPMTPRTGALPEMNALWFQARCLQALWADENSIFNAPENWRTLETLGRAALDETLEYERPNRIFLHSIPLAPSMVLQDQMILERDLKRIFQKLWTPVGLRTLDPENPEYRTACCGSQEERDRAYHQGPVWGWLGGHYEMARARMTGKALPAGRTLSDQVRKKMPIRGHIPELFDSEEPHQPRGTPAQAWSLACLEEAAARIRSGWDAKLTRLLAKRWLGRTERKGIRGASSPDARSSTDKPVKKKASKISGAAGL